MEEYPEYNIYRGLQRPFSLFGLKGINIVWGVTGVGGGFLGYIVFYYLFGFLWAMILTVLIIGFCGYKINYHMKNGLYNKKKMPGIWICKNLIKPTFK